MRQILKVFRTVLETQWHSAMPSVANMYGGLAVDQSLCKGFPVCVSLFSFYYDKAPLREKSLFWLRNEAWSIMVEKSQCREIGPLVVSAAMK